LIIAHRVATAARTDLVAWLDRGRLRRLGRHTDLWRDPDYRALFGTEAAPAETQGRTETLGRRETQELPAVSAAVR
jgi:ATP-binding cassette subfamily B protein